MSSDLQQRLADLAGDAPRSLDVHGGDVWRAGVRRQRRRRAGAVTSTVAAAAVVVGGIGLVGPVEHRTPSPAEVPASELHLPRTLYAPDPWAPGTDETGPPGPLAAVGYARRNHPEGLFDRRQVLDLFGVSAADGSTVFLDLPHSTDPDGSTRLGYGVSALSPDGTKFGYVRYEDDPGRSDDLGEDPFLGEFEQVRVVGWNVYDTLTGELTELRVPGMPEIRGTDVFEIEFSGDSQYLLTNYSPTGSDGGRDDTFVAWHVETAERVVVEGTGHYWLPNVGPAPDGVLWGRKQRILRFDPDTGETTSVAVPHDVMEPSIGPDGRALAYVGHRPTPPDEPARWHLYAGEDAGETRRIELDIDPDGILGWRDARRVVVQQLPDRGLRVVDVVTGDYRVERLDRQGEVMWQVYASDLWRNAIVPGVEPPQLPDPRWWMRPVTWVIAALGALAGLAGWRRRRGRS